MNIEDFKIIGTSPNKIVTYIEILAKIKNNETGEIRDFLSRETWDDEENCFNSYMWSEGNFSCDCNRELFFYNNDENYEEPEDLKCGETRFSVNLYNPKNGQLIYEEYGDGC